MLHKKSTQGWRTIWGKNYYFRSMWEANYARWLSGQKQAGLIKEWEHEPETFWFLEIKRGVRSYLPDFRVTHNDDSVSYYEVKGFYDAKSVTKINRFRKYYPDHKLILIDKKWFEANSKKLRVVIPHWETGENNFTR